MTDHQLATILHQLRRTAAEQAGIGDAELLQRFVRDGDDASFELLMWRHARLVCSVCRRVLQNEHDAEDAFQVTFLALARQAGRIENGACLAGWLYKVAYRAALTARAHRARRRELPWDGVEPVARSGGGSQFSEQDRAALDQEISRLPERFQIPVVLCYLEGKSVSETALLLGWPRGTVASRLARARGRLRARLARRGLEFTDDLPGVANDGDGSPPLTVAIPVLAKQILAEAAADSVLAPQIASLTNEVMKAMFLSKLKTQAILVITVLGLILAGGGWVIHIYAVSPKEPFRKDADEPQTKKADEPSKPKPPAQAAPKSVTVVRPMRREAAPYADYTGRLVALQQVDVRPTVSGRLEKVLFQAGADVKKGELLFEIDPRSYELAVEKAKAHLSSLKTEVGEKNKALQRAKALEKTGAINSEALDEVASRASAAEAALRPAQVEVEQAHLKLEATKIAAPFDGRIGEPRINPGNQVYAGADKAMVLATITVLDPIGLNFDMDERSYLRYQHLLREKEVKGTGSPLSIGVSDEDGFPREAMLVGFGDRIEKDGTIRARAKLANRDGLLLPGMFARVRVSFGRPRLVIEVPRKALGRDGGKDYVLVVNDQNHVERRNVQTESLVMVKGRGQSLWVPGSDDQ
ncbi:MAG TPA: efflux RND transporter periplasmic adaptor subunit, partial [Gemmataceae bacterium]|nr:efflux RND transporter periplasmic adaptor subunit [Gemmataceae bacterium]